MALSTKQKLERLFKKSLGLTDGYSFKKSHGFGYALLIIAVMNKLELKRLLNEV